MEDQLAIENFCRYLRIRTVQPNPDYAGCVEFLKKYAIELELEFKLLECKPGKPIVIMSWVGINTSAKSLLLNSHTDVVPVAEEHWNADPFGGIIQDGKIISRGAQDMKCVGIGYLEAIRRLKKSGFQPNRTIHLSFVPDEEIGGGDGMALFVKTELFKELNIGVALDEGIPSSNESFYIFNQERAPWWIRLDAQGSTGHGSTLPQGTAMEKLFRVMQKIYTFRESQIKELCKNGGLLGEVTSVNITKCSAGLQTNVIPDKASMTIDVRISPSLGEAEFARLLEEWVAGTGVTISFENKASVYPASRVDEDDENWSLISSTFHDLGLTFSVETFTGATDSRYLRAIGIPAYGISPFNRTPLLLHDHNEYLEVEVFTKGIKIYESLIRKLSQ